ncbi:unnamed protein product [Ambrosiozyma monospora]|uniref:Unnamed protein product n=1 Tax=Ambrosiozyma monospora TaxID=43982 RepID=A0A9W6YTC1_AMBMO|nr:unnamed protein product [Ambrosiozyma monospora]
MSNQTSTAAKRLWKEYRDISHPKDGLQQVRVEFDEDNIYLWRVALLVLDPESDYKGAYLKGQLKFPTNYPYSPPNFKFTPPIYHPNVYNDGRLCISILHEAQEQTDEPLNETWSPVQSVESVLISVLSLLEDPNISSPANVDAAVAWKKNKPEYKRRVENEVKRSRANMPEGFVFPNLNDLANKKDDEEESQIDEQEEKWWDENYDDDDDDEEDGEYDEFEDDDEDQEDEEMEDSTEGQNGIAK